MLEYMDGILLSEDSKMKCWVPNYYSDFACKMGACRHSCCIGWEIDIDADALAHYRAVGGAFGARLAAHIAEDDSGAHFILDARDRCPFLNADGLCDLILNLGADALCQICADHPRYRNFFSDREEIGLGLCCEAAGRLILGRKAPAHFEVRSDDGAEDAALDADEADLIDLRDRLMEIAQDRRLPMDARIQRVLRETDLIDLPLRPENRIDLLLDLERLDEAWAQLLEALRAAPDPEPPILPEQELPLEQLLVYLLMRHLPAALEDDDLAGRIAFVLFIWQLLRDLFALRKSDLEGMIEIARMYSSEIEYSDENIGRIIDALREHCSI